MPIHIPMLASFLDVNAILRDAPELWGYVIVYFLAMVPAIEPFIVVPAAIGLGLDPLLTGIAAFAGSTSAMGAIVLSHERLAAWWTRRSDGDDPTQSGRYGRARRMWRRYGTIGLAFGGPPLAGIHLTALLAGIVGSDSRSAIVWLSAGIGTWIALLSIASIVGFSAIGIV